MVLPLLAVCVTAAPACARMPPFHAATIEHGRLERVDGGFWILSLDGTAEQRGQAAGTLVGEQVRWLLPRYLKQVAALDQLSPHHREVVQALAAEIPAAHMAQVNALADAAKVDRTTLLAVNLAPEMLAELACSCLATTAAASADGKVHLARNLDWPGGELLTGADLVTIEDTPAYRFASFTWPGLVGVVTGMNEAGVAAADLVALKTGNRRPQPGVPVLFAVRSMLERAGSVDEALAWLKAARRTMPQNYAIVDRQDVRVVETAPLQFRVRESRGGTAVITNYWHEESGHASDGRYARLTAAAGAKPGVAELEQALAATAIKRLNVQAVVLEPETATAFVARGKPPVAQGSWARIDLSARLRGGGPGAQLAP